MTFYIQPINTATDSFGQWISKSNQSFAVFSNNAVTTDAGRPTPSNTAVGNAAISGTFFTGSLIASANLMVSTGAANIYMQQQNILIRGNLTTNNNINSNGMMLDNTTLYYREVMTISNTIIRGANVTSNSGFFENLRIGNTSVAWTTIANTGINTNKVNTNILYVTGPNAFASIGTNEANVYITKDAIEVYNNPSGTAVQNSKMTATDLWIDTVHANTFGVRNGYFSFIGVAGGDPFLTVTCNTHFIANTLFQGANNQYQFGLASNGNIDIVGANVQFSHRYYNQDVQLGVNVVSVYTESDGGAWISRNLFGNSTSRFTTYEQGEGIRLGEGRSTFYNIVNGIPGNTISYSANAVGVVGQTFTGFSANVFLGWPANSTVGWIAPYANTTLVVNGAIRFLTAQGGGSVSFKANTTPGSMSSVNFILPSNTGSSGQVLTVDNAGKLSFKDEFTIKASDYIRIAGLGVGVAYNPPSAGFGEIRAGGNITAYYSDQRLKENIESITDSLNKVTQLRGITFNSNEVARQNGYNDDSRQAGVIAQEVQAVLPEAVKLAPFDTRYGDDGRPVSKSGENYLTVQYEKLVPLLIEAIKELKKEIDELKASK